MDKVWYGNSSRSEVIGHCDGDDKTNDPAAPTSQNLIKM